MKSLNKSITGRMLTVASIGFLLTTTFIAGCARHRGGCQNCSTGACADGSCHTGAESYSSPSYGEPVYSAPVQSQPAPTYSQPQYSAPPAGGSGSRNPVGGGGSGTRGF